MKRLDVVETSQLTALKETAVTAWEKDLTKNSFGYVAMRGDDGQLIECVDQKPQTHNSQRDPNWDLLVNGERHFFTLPFETSLLSLVLDLQHQSPTMLQYDFVGIKRLRYGGSKDTNFDVLMAIKAA